MNFVSGKRGALKLLKTVLCITACAITASAGTVTYTETVTTSGNLDGVPFTNTLVTLSLTGDTANVVNDGGGNLHLQGTLNINVAGVGSDALLDPANAQVYQLVPNAGFFADSAMVLFTNNSAFASYGLTAPIGPLTGTSIGYTGGSYKTASGGSFYLAGPFNVDHPSTFTATLQNPVPEPGTLLVVLGGLAGAWTTRKLKVR